MTSHPDPSLNGHGGYPPRLTLEGYLQQIRASAQTTNPTLGDLRAYQQWTGLLAGLVLSLLATHPQTRPIVEQHAREWGWLR